MPNTGALGSPDQQAATKAAQPAASSAAAFNQGYANPYAMGTGAVTPLAGVTANDLSNPNYQSELAGYLTGAADPSLASSQLASAQGAAQLGGLPTQGATSAAELGNQTGYSLAGDLLGYEGTQLQSQGLAQQATTAAQQQGLEQAQFGVSQTQYPEQQQQAALANQNAVIANRDAAAIGGVTDTTSSKRTAATQASEYGWQQADIFRNQQLSKLQQQSEEAGFTGQEDQFANQRAQLGLAAQGQGLSAQQHYDQLSFGLQQLGISQSPEQYLKSIADSQSGGAQGLSAIISQASLLGGLGPNGAGG